jgi:hypothetical protein
MRRPLTINARSAAIVGTSAFQLPTTNYQSLLTSHVSLPRSPGLSDFDFFGFAGGRVGTNLELGVRQTGETHPSGYWRDGGLQSRKRMAGAKRGDLPGYLRTRLGGLAWIGAHLSKTRVASANQRAASLSKLPLWNRKQSELPWPNKALTNGELWNYCPGVHAP